jgi:hypothetical protein
MLTLSVRPYHSAPTKYVDPRKNLKPNPLISLSPLYRILELQAVSLNPSTFFTFRTKEWILQAPNVDP